MKSRDRSVPLIDLPAVMSRTRRQCLSHLMAVGGSALMPATRASAQQDAPLSFDFIRNPPGQLYSVGSHRLHAWCTGKGDTTVVFEPGLGGSALEWLPLTEALDDQALLCLYDRAGYAWSDPGSNPRHVGVLARELQSLLNNLHIDGKLILVGHSYGGLVVRQLANLLPARIKGMILVDASHENQFLRLSNASDVAMLPTSRHFVVNAPELPDALRPDIRNKIMAFSRMRKTYAALHAEITSFGESCEFTKRNRMPYKFPVTVITRGLNPYAQQQDDSDAPDGNPAGASQSDKRNEIWHELQSDLLMLSPDSRQIIARDSGHHIHIDQPDIVKQAIVDLLQY